MSNIPQVVNKEKTMTILKKGIHAAGLDQVLSGTGPFTVIAPSDLAFEKLEAGRSDVGTSNGAMQFMDAVLKS